MIDDLKILTGESDEKLLSLLILRAKNIVLSETNRTVLIAPLENVVLELALELYNKQGSEGEQSRTEGGISVSYSNDISPYISNTLNNYRLIRVAGYAFEQEEI